jgi:hypothetical protein
VRRHRGAPRRRAAVMADGASIGAANRAPAGFFETGVFQYNTPFETTPTPQSLHKFMQDFDCNPWSAACCLTHAFAS